MNEIHNEMKHCIVDGHYQRQTLCRKTGLAVAALQQRHSSNAACVDNTRLRAAAVQRRTRAAVSQPGSELKHLK